MASAEGAIGGRRTPVQRAWQRVGHRADGRAPLWIEIGIIAWLFWLYDVINDLAPLRHVLALHNAEGLLSAEQSLHLDPELTLNRWLEAHHTLALLGSYYYFFAHAVVTFAVLGVLWWRNPPLYMRMRTKLVVINLIAFVVFWRYPLAPPRTFTNLGFVDVIAHSGALVSWSSGPLVHDADQFAAMPSLHIAWSTWSAIAIWGLTRRRLIRLVATLYPILTAFIVLGTGNHYLFDVLGGGVTVILAFGIYRAAEALLALNRRRRLTLTAPTEHSVLEPAEHSAAGRGVAAQS